MTRPVLLDLYCGAGGASMGYYQAGFDVLGVDIAYQPHYPFRFERCDALTYLRTRNLDGIAAVHASPPCQRYSKMGACRPGLRATYPDLVAPTRASLIRTGLPYVIENVVEADLRSPIFLCGLMFNRELYRHRLFECNFPICQPSHPRHVVPASSPGKWKPGTVMTVVGHAAPMKKAEQVMGIRWMTRDELTEAIPPDYTKFIGKQLIAIKRLGDRNADPQGNEAALPEELAADQ